MGKKTPSHTEPLAADDPCPCDSGRNFASCCAPLLTGQAASSAEALMRSRYTAHVLNATDYLLHSWSSRTRPARIEADRKARWLGLKLLRVEAGGKHDDNGVVEFVARFKINGRGQRIHEISRFEREQGRWVYLDGNGEPADKPASARRRRR